MQLKRYLAFGSSCAALSISAGCLDETLDLAVPNASVGEGGGKGGALVGDAGDTGRAGAEAAGGDGRASGGTPALGGAAGDAAGGVPSDGGDAGAAGLGGNGPTAAGAAGASGASTGEGGQGGAAEPIGCTEELCGPNFCADGIGECTFTDGVLDCTGEVGDTAIYAESTDMAVLRVDMAGASELRLAAKICDPTGYVLNLGDSPTNDGGGGDAVSSTNDAEILIQGTRLDVFSNDLGAQNGFHPSLVNQDDYVAEQGCTTRALSVGDQVITDLHDPPAFYFESSFLLRIDPADDQEGTPDALWWLGLNHVARTDSTRAGTGVESVRLCFTQALAHQCPLDGYGRDPDVGSCESSPSGWQGCVSNGCAVCEDALAEYPNYLANHPCCASVTPCPGQPSACNSYCPEPTEADK